MNYLSRVALLGFAATAMPARADFQITSMLPGAAQSGQPMPSPVVLSPEIPDRQQRRAPALVVPIAYGFGKQVPLAFATRQIVPGQIRVTFGPDVKEDALVDWTGGRPWHEVLWAAVHPLGLHTTIGWMTVFITRR